MMMSESRNPSLPKKRKNKKKNKRKNKARKPWVCLGLKVEDGEVVALPFRRWTLRDDNVKDVGRSYVVDWYSLDLDKGEISSICSKMPTKGCLYLGTAVACGNRVYVIGGVCHGDINCPNKETDISHGHDYVFYLDSDQPLLGWREAKHLMQPWGIPVAVAAGEDIYIFGPDNEVQVYRANLDIWESLGNNSGMDLFWVTTPLLFDSSRSRILVHFHSNSVLYAYHYRYNQWECLDERFGIWPDSVVILDDVMYCLVKSPDAIQPLMAYDLCSYEWLTVTFSSDFQLPLLHSSKLVYLGKGKWCIIGYRLSYSYFLYLKVSVVCVCNEDDVREIQVTAESKSATTVEVPNAYLCEIPNLCI